MTKVDLKVGQVFKCNSKGLDETVEVTLIDTDSSFKHLHFQMINGGKHYNTFEDDGVSIAFPIDCFLNYYTLINA